jgi:hypothetical protein
MNISSRSSNFNSAQMATDQREGRPDDLSASVTPSPGIYQSNSTPHYNPCSLENWSRYISQPGFMPSFQRSQYSYPATDNEPYNLAPSHQALNTHQTNYMDAHTPIHVNPVMETPDKALVAEVKEQSIHENLDWQPSPTCKTEDFYHHHVQWNAFQPVQNSPPSPLSTISSYPSPQSYVAASPARTGRTSERLSPRSSSGDTKERPGNPPYSILIYQALITAEGNKLSLQGIYRWFEKHTDKGRDSNHKGWQNSIRHNLSMNAVSYALFHYHMFHFEFTFASHSDSLPFFIVYLLTLRLGLRSCEARHGHRKEGDQFLEADPRGHQERNNSVNDSIPEGITKRNCLCSSARCLRVSGGVRLQESEDVQYQQSEPADPASRK